MHESFVREADHQQSSDRAFGLTVGGILAVIQGFRWWNAGSVDAPGWCLLVVATGLIAAALIHPPALAKLNRAWMRLGELMFLVVNPLVMLLIFIVTIVPIGLLMRAFGKDPLRLKRSSSSSSYWIERNPPGPEPGTMKKQF